MMGTLNPTKKVHVFICANQAVEQTVEKSCVHFSDIEPTMLALEDAAARALPNVKAIPEGHHSGSIKPMARLKGECRSS